MIKRYTASLFGALAITFALFLGMNYLIAPDKTPVSDVKPEPPIIIGTVREATRPDRTIEKPVRPEPESTPVDFPKPNPKTNPNGPVIGTGIPQIPPTGPTDDIATIGLSEGDIQPITKFAPNYPSDLASKGIEGYVVVKFTVSEIGTVENLVIVESTHRSFNRSSIRAVKKYKYKPRVIDGTAVAVHDVMEKISFKIDQNS